MKRKVITPQRVGAPVPGPLPAYRAVWLVRARDRTAQSVAFVRQEPFEQRPVAGQLLEHERHPAKLF